MDHRGKQNEKKRYRHRDDLARLELSEFLHDLYIVSFSHQQLK